MTRKPSLTIGIPAYNEEQNIAYLLKSLVAQKQINYRLTAIVVVNDGSTDKTVQKVTALAKRYSEISIIADGKRLGKTSRLNQLYQLCKTDYLLTLDADIAVASESTIASLFDVVTAQPHAAVVAGDIVPVPSAQGFIARILYANSLLWNSIRRQINRGNSIYNMYGSATLIRAAFAKTITYPSVITCDEGYLFVLAQRAGAFAFAPKAVFYNRPVTTIADYRLLASRSLREHADLVACFGEEVQSFYFVPRILKIRSILQSILKQPITDIVIILLNLSVTLFPYKDELNKEGKWRQVKSTKPAIRVQNGLYFPTVDRKPFSIIQLFLVYFESLFLTRKHKAFRFPKQIGVYEFIKPMYSNRRHRPYTFGLYKQGGMSAIVKMWHGTHKNFDYMSLANEISVYRYFDQLDSDQKRDLVREHPTVTVPTFLDAGVTDTEVALVVEKVSGNELSQLSTEKKIRVYGEVMAYLAALPTVGQPYLTTRSIVHLTMILPLLWMAAVLKYPTSIGAVSKAAWHYLRFATQLAKQDLCFVHKSLEDHNILIKNNKATLIDFQLSVVTHPLIEVAQTCLFAWRDQRFCQAFLADRAAIQRVGTNASHLAAIALYTAIHHMAFGDQPYDVVKDYLDYFLQTDQAFVSAKEKAFL